MKRLLLIYNPAAGKGHINSALSEIIQHYVGFGYSVNVHPTLQARDATRIVLEEGAQYDHIVCSGGDGTLNEVVTGLLQLPDPPALGYIPAGSTNDFARNLHLPSGLVNAADCAVQGVPHRVDMGDFNGRTFVYVAAFGAFTDVSYETPQEYKNIFGHLAYVLEGMSRLGSLTTYPMKVSYNGETIEDEFLYGMVSNTVSVGGLIGFPKDEVDLSDGKFEVMLIRAPKSAVELNGILRSLLHQKPSGNVIGFKTDQLTITAQSEVPWTLDGEYGGSPATAVIQNRKQVITLLQGE